MTTTTSARETIYQAFVTAWGSTSALTFDNEKFTPTPGQSWVRLTVRHADSDQETLGGVGNRKFNRPGSVFVQVFTPLNAGARAADTLANTARDVFEGTTISSIRFQGVTVRELGEDDGWYSMLVEAPFAYDTTK